jgi:peroxiredoxin Q/BCP
MNSILGKKAPKFKLKNQNGETVELNQFKGAEWIVVYFYPKAMTPGCTVQAQCLRDNSKELKKRKVVVLGISPDPVERLMKFREKENLNFDLLSDELHEVAESYGAWGDKKLYGKSYKGILRSTFLIDKSGKVVGHFPKVNTKTHHEDLLSLIDELNEAALGD